MGVRVPSLVPIDERRPQRRPEDFSGSERRAFRPVELRLNFEVSASECDRELNNAYRAYAARRGCLGSVQEGAGPADQKQIQSQVVHEVSEVIIGRAYREAVQQEALQPVTPPRLRGNRVAMKASRFALRSPSRCVLRSAQEDQRV